MTAHETTPSDAAYGVAFKQVSLSEYSVMHGVEVVAVSDVVNRAREIEQGRGALPEFPEPTAYCAPDNPFNTSAFSWPGSDRRVAHTDALYTAEQMTAYGEACRRMGNRDE